MKKINIDDKLYLFLIGYIEAEMRSIMVEQIVIEQI